MPTVRDKIVILLNGDEIRDAVSAGAPNFDAQLAVFPCTEDQYRAFHANAKASGTEVAFEQAMGETLQDAFKRVYGG